MDFHSLLNKAAKNATSVNKTLETVDSEIAERKRQELKKIEADKRAKQDLALKKRALIPKRESTPEKKFVIPKKKTESSVDINGVKNFLAKQEESKKIAEKQKKIEKDNLIQLRIQSHGGKANKKIGKQFGMDPIHLQIRYGNDHTHVERLQKQQWREEEELDNLSTQYKGGVYKAIQERNKKLAEIKPGDKKEPHRVATSKSNSLYGLSSRHGNTRDHFSPPKDTKKEATKPPPVSAERKRPAAPPVDFNALMKVAADKTAGKNVDLSTLAPPPPKISKQNMDRPSSSKDVRPNYPSSSNSFKKPSALPSSSTKDQRDPQRTSNSSMSSKPKPTPSNSSSTKRPEAKPVSKTDSSSNTAKQSDKDNKGSKDAKGRFVKAPTPPPAIPSAVLGRRYLPGDVRIKQQQEMMKAAGITPSSSSSHKKGPDMESLFGSSRKPESSKVRAPDNRVSSSSNNYSSSSSAQRYSQPSSKSSSKPNVSRDKEKVREIERRKRAMEKQRYEKIRWEGMSLVERERERERQKFREMYQDEEEDEDDDEYDSGDDFIDDSGMDMDDFNRMDFEETLKMVNPKYDEKKWKIREKMISERDMETNYRNISREEARSARLGFMEDVLEAKKGKSIRL